MVAITLDELKQVDRVVGVAGGPEKLEAIRAALLGGYINVLITDQRIGYALLQDKSHLAEVATDARRLA